MKAYKRNLRYLDNIEQKLCRTRDYGMTARTQLKKDEVSKMIKLFAVKYKNDKVLKNDKQYFESLNKEQECIEEKPKDKKIKIKGKKECLASKNDSSTYAHSLQNLSESYVTIRQANMGAFDTKNMNHNKLRRNSNILNQQPSENIFDEQESQFELNILKGIYKPDV